MAKIVKNCRKYPNFWYFGRKILIFFGENSKIGVFWHFWWFLVLRKMKHVFGSHGHATAPTAFIFCQNVPPMGGSFWQSRIARWPRLGVFRTYNVFQNLLCCTFLLIKRSKIKILRPLCFFNFQRSRNESGLRIWIFWLFY